MSDDPNGASGTPEENPEGNSGNQNANPAGGKPDTVSRRAYEKALSEKRTAQERLRKLEADEDDRKKADLERDGDLTQKVEYYKGKVEESQTQITDLNTKLEGHDKRWQAASKLSAFREALPGPLKSEGYWDLVDTSKIIIDPEGNIEQSSVKKYVDEFTAKYPDTIQKTSHPNSPNNYPNGSTQGALTFVEWEKLPLKERKARVGELQQ